MAIPFGIYDLGRSQGFIIVGTSHQTPEFAVAAIRRWWLQVGREHYPDRSELLIECDGGKSERSELLALEVRPATTG